MTLQYEFDTIEKWKEAQKHLELYHDCEKCHGKIVAISIDKSGNTCCGYCGEQVNYPRMNKEVFKKYLKSYGIIDGGVKHD